jgi:hypothetical protein
MILRLLLLLMLGAVSVFSASVDLSPDAAKAEAQRDIDAGHMKIYIAGTEGAYEPGVKKDDLALLSKLPRDRSLPMGCTVPRAPDAIAYAEAYNRAIIRWLRSSKSH